ncbi:MAG: hypothetical protein K8W52_40850 [Deltaproteobacteria bacterium]|nr:hypothetical protein [Deltaproteobacteria bacterium]
MEPPRQAPTRPELSPAEYAVLFHVVDTVVLPREQLAAYAADNLPNVVPPDLTVDGCREAIASLVARGWLVELTQADIDADLARWQREPLPVSWGVALDRRVGDVDATDAGFRGFHEAAGWALVPSRAYGYVHEGADQLRVLGDSVESCQRQLEGVLAGPGPSPWPWPPDETDVAPATPRGPWWVDRFRCIPGGFERILRRRDTSVG